jgi:uncharacterized protein YbjT (DUF2867 family)
LGRVKRRAVWTEVAMIIVTGTTGKLGSQIVERLLQRAPADQIAVSVRVPVSSSRLTGSDAVDLQQVAAILQEVTGRTVSRLVDANEGTTDPGSAQ